MPESTLDHSIPYPSPSDPVRGSTADYLQTDLRDLALGADAAITTAVADRAPLTHTHSVDDVSELQAELDILAQPDVIAVAEGIYSTTQATEVTAGIHSVAIIQALAPEPPLADIDAGAAWDAYTGAAA